ncbi:MAG: SDR family NAD-dependent epimerase/dehydratase, partial [Phycisphaera sp.]|nr:SDR family NAD-dependent epimerase/dehydratase [Phycisphaera sp.]
TTAADRLDWKAAVGFEDGLRRTIDWFIENRRKIEAAEAAPTT